MLYEYKYTLHMSGILTHNISGDLYLFTYTDVQHDFHITQSSSQVYAK
jgi:hypothetical protein